MTQHEEELFKEIVEASKPFLSSDNVDETSGTIPLTERLEKVIEQIEEILK